eukprot:jgi/Mesen1/10601/ME000086S10138
MARTRGAMSSCCRFAVRLSAARGSGAHSQLGEASSITNRTPNPSGSTSPELLRDDFKRLEFENMHADPVVAGRLSASCDMADKTSRVGSPSVRSPLGENVGFPAATGGITSMAHTLLQESLRLHRSRASGFSSADCPGLGFIPQGSQSQRPHVQSFASWSSSGTHARHSLLRRPPQVMVQERLRECTRACHLSARLLSARHLSTGTGSRLAGSKDSGFSGFGMGDNVPPPGGGFGRAGGGGGGASRGGGGGGASDGHDGDRSGMEGVDLNRSFGVFDESNQESEAEQLPLGTTPPDELFEPNTLSDDDLDSLILLRDLDGIEGLPPLHVLRQRQADEEAADKAARREAERLKQEGQRAARVRQVDKLGRAYATGKRKSSVARVWLAPGSGRIVVNGRTHDAYFPDVNLRAHLLQPFVETATLGTFDVRATVQGGGTSGQAGAMRHGISRALQLFEPALRPPLKAAGFLTRDSRVVERKKPGKAKARKSFQWVKR